MVKLRRLMNELYKCDILGGIGHVLQNVVDLVCRLPIFSKTYNEMKALLNTMFNTGFIYILKEKMGLDKLAVVSKPWCSNATEWNKPYNMGNWLLCRREVIKDSMVDGRSGKFFTSDKRDEWTSDDKFDVISLILSYYRPWKIEIMFHSREKSYLSDLVVIGSLNPKPSNIDMERVMKGFNYVNRDLQLHKSMKLKYNEIFLRHNLKSLQKLGRI